MADAPLTRPCCISNSLQRSKDFTPHVPDLLKQGLYKEDRWTTPKECSRGHPCSTHWMTRTRALRRQMAEVKLSRGEHLFMEGDDGDALYVVLDGKMKLTRAAAGGRENLLSVIGPGEMFGELSLFDPRPRTSSASAVTDAVLAALKHEALTP